MKYSNSIAWHTKLFCNIHKIELRKMKVGEFTIPYCNMCTDTEWKHKRNKTKNLKNSIRTDKELHKPDFNKHTLIRNEKRKNAKNKSAWRFKKT